MKCCKSKFELIIEGWTGLIFKTERTKQIAEQRAKICAICEQNKDNWCKICKCFIPAKVRSRNSECPSKLWLKDV